MEKEVKLKNFPNLRTIYIGEIIDHCAVRDFKKDLDLLIKTDEEVYRDNVKSLGEISPALAEAYKENVKFPPIYIDITSPGGEVYSGLSMYDTIRNYNETSGHELIAHLSGAVASMATQIMLACKKRVAGKHTSFLIHSISGCDFGKIEDLKNNLVEMERVDKMCKNIYISNTKISLERLQEVDRLKEEWWISAEEALELGLITNIE